MVSLRRKKQDQQSLVEPSRSGWFGGKKGPRSEDAQRKKRFPRVFRKKTDEPQDKLDASRNSKSSETPPPTPEAASPLNVTIVTTEVPEPLTPEEHSFSATTISDLSVSVQKWGYSTPVKENDTITDTNAEQNTSISTVSGESVTKNAICTNDAITNLFGMVDQACGTAKGKTPGSPEQNSPGNWGVAPSEDEDDTVFDSTRAGSDQSQTRNGSEEKRDPSTIDQSGHNTYGQETGTKSSVGGSEKTAHENFELVLDKSARSDPDGTPKRKTLGWLRKKPSLEDKTRENEREAKFRAVFGADPDGQQVPTQKKLPNFVKRLSTGLSKESDDSATTKSDAQTLTEQLMKAEELLGDEIAEEEVCADAAKADVVEKKSADKAEPEKILEDIEMLSKANPPKDKRARSWATLTQSLTGKKEPVNQQVNETNDTAVTRVISSPVRMLSSSFGVKQPAKPTWKSAMDPTTGRTYYYHRLTRKTTWTKPDGFDSQSQAAKAAPRNTLPNEAHSCLEDDVERTKEVLLVSGNNEDAKRTEEQGKQDVDVQDQETPAASPNKFDPAVWEKKREISQLLKAMSPPDQESISKIMAQYEGREDELLLQLHDLVNTRPFDEPIQHAKADELPMDEPVHTRVASDVTRTRTANTSYTGVSGKTENTAKITNTTSGRAVFEAITELDERNEHSSLSSFDDESSEERRRRQYRGGTERTRDLRVEEFTSSRWGLTKENYNEKGLPTNRRTTDSESTSIENESNYHGDNDETDLETYGTDSISALSTSDVEFTGHKDRFNHARRRALDEAIRNGDWELAESATQGVRGTSSKRRSSVDISKEWTQSELDQFISENDWDAVAKYIAHMRDNANEKKISSGSEAKARGRTKERLAKVKMDEQAYQKRFGARSQLQHKELASVSSWDTDSFYDTDDDFSSASSVSYGHGLRKEFVC